MELLPSHAFSTLVRDYRRGVDVFLGLKLEIRDRLTSACQKNIPFFFSSFLQSFQSSKKTWMFTWACSSSLSPAARVGTVPLLGFFSVLLCKTHRTAPTGPSRLFFLMLVFWRPPSPLCRSKAQHLGRERLPPASLLSQGSELPTSGRGALGRAFHWWNICRTFQWRLGSGGKVSVPNPF